MRDLVIGIDPGTKNSGICVLLNVAGVWCPQYIGEQRLSDADPYKMTQMILDAIDGWIGFGSRDRVVHLQMEDFRARCLQGAALRVLEVIGAVRYAAKQRGCIVELPLHAQWRAEWSTYLMGRIAAGGSAPSWMSRLKEHELDASKIAFVKSLKL